MVSTRRSVIFKLDGAKQEAAMETARRKIAEVDAALLAAQADILKAEGQIQEAKGAYQQASDELDTKRELQKRNPSVTEIREIPGRGHSLTIDHGWREVAETALAFIAQHLR